MTGSNHTYFRRLEDDTIYRYIEHGPLTEVMTKETHFNRKGRPVLSRDFDPLTGVLSKSTDFFPDGTTSRIRDYDATGTVIKHTHFHPDRTSSIEYNVGGESKFTKFYPDGITESVAEYDSNKRMKKRTFFREGGTIKESFDIDPVTGKVIKDTSFSEDGTIKESFDMDPVTEKAIKHTSFHEDGTIENIVEVDPVTRQPLMSVLYDNRGKIENMTLSDGRGDLVSVHKLVNQVQFEDNLKGFLYTAFGLGLKRDPKTLANDQIAEVQKRYHRGIGPIEFCSGLIGAAAAVPASIMAPGIAAQEVFALVNKQPSTAAVIGFVCAESVVVLGTALFLEKNPAKAVKLMGEAIETGWYIGAAAGRQIDKIFNNKNHTPKNSLG